MLKIWRKLSLVIGIVTVFDERSRLLENQRALEDDFNNSIDEPIFKYDDTGQLTRMSMSEVFLVMLGWECQALVYL